MVDESNGGNGRVTQQDLYAAIASLREEMTQQFQALGSRLDSIQERHPTHAEMNACLSALEAELHGKIGESQADRALIRKEIDSINRAVIVHDKTLSQLKGGFILASLLLPILSGVIVAMVAHFIGT